MSFIIVIIYYVFIKKSSDILRKLFTRLAKLALTTLDKLTLKRFPFGSREQTLQAGASVTLQQ